MSAVDHPKRISELRAWYGERVRGYLGARFGGDMSITHAAATWLVRFVVQHQPRVVVELGSGFSTLAFARAMTASPNTRLLSVDHDEKWLAFVHACVAQKGLPVDRIDRCTMVDFWAKESELDGCGLIFVDHGPDYAARIAAIAPVIGLARRIGCKTVVLDDWHKARGRRALYCEPVTKIAAAAGCSVGPIAASSTPADARALAQVVLEPVQPRALARAGYVGHERTYWQRRFARYGTSLLAVGRRDADVTTNHLEYDAALEELARMVEADFPARLSSRRDLSVLDLGYGHGHYALACHALGFGHYVGVDFASPPGPDLGPDYVYKTLDIATPFDLQRKFDLVLGLDVLFHIVDGRAFLQALHNIRAHAKDVVYLTGTFEAGDPSPHVRHRRFEDHAELGGKLMTIAPWRDNRIARFKMPTPKSPPVGQRRARPEQR